MNSVCRTLSAATEEFVGFSARESRSVAISQSDESVDGRKRRQVPKFVRKGRRTGASSRWGTETTRVKSAPAGKLLDVNHRPPSA